MPLPLLLGAAALPAWWLALPTTTAASLGNTAFFLSAYMGMTSLVYTQFDFGVYDQVQVKPDLVAEYVAKLEEAGGLKRFSYTTGKPLMAAITENNPNYPVPEGEADVPTEFPSTTSTTIKYYYTDVAGVTSPSGNYGAALRAGATHGPFNTQVEAEAAQKAMYGCPSNAYMAYASLGNYSYGTGYYQGRYQTTSTVCVNFPQVAHLKLVNKSCPDGYSFKEGSNFATCHTSLMRKVDGICGIKRNFTTHTFYKNPFDADCAYVDDTKFAVDPTLVQMLGPDGDRATIDTGSDPGNTKWGHQAPEPGGGSGDNGIGHPNPTPTSPTPPVPEQTRGRTPNPVPPLTPPSAPPQTPSNPSSAPPGVYIPKTDIQCGGPNQPACNMTVNFGDPNSGAPTTSPGGTSTKLNELQTSAFLPTSQVCPADIFTFDFYLPAPASRNVTISDGGAFCEVFAGGGYDLLLRNLEIAAAGIMAAFIILRA